MTEDKDVTDVAVAWVETLRARGVTLQLRGTRLAYRPKSAYGALNDAERTSLKEHKEAIVAVLRDRYSGTAHAIVSADALVTHEEVRHVEPALEPCRWCYRSPCIGSTHPAFYVLHPNEVQQRVDEHATDDYAQLDPETRVREREAAAIRRRLGWDAVIVRDPFR